MALINILKRRDAASVLAAIVIGFLLVQLISSLPSRPIGLLLGLEDGTYASFNYPGASFVANYVFPVMLFIAQILLLEILTRVYILVRSLITRR